MSLWVGLLGPLEVRRDGLPLAVPRGKSEVVLAVLALSAGQPVTVDSIADRVWRGGLPERVAGSLQSHVMRLRRALGPAAIRTVGPAYLLDVDPDRVDVLRFRRLAAEAGGLDDAAAARELLDEALRLWRGEPLSGLRPDAFEHDEVPVLVEERAGVLTRRIEIDLAAGRHAEVVAELRDLTRRHPLREPLWRQLVVALAGSGRQAEALEAYHDLRVRLRDHLGVDPSPDLQDLYAGLLGRRPLAAGPKPVPAALPAPSTPLVGRQQELATALHLLDDEEVRLVTLTGAGGAGKTRLALAAAAGLGGQSVLVDLAPLVSLLPLREGQGGGHVWTAIQEALGLHDAPGVPPARRVTEHLAGSRALLLLDNFEHVLPAAAAVSALMARCPHLKLLVTSRVPLRLRGERVLHVPPLPVPEAVTLLVRQATAAGAALSLDGEDATAVAEICRRLDCLPLALELAAPWLRVLTPRALLEHLEGRLSILAGGEDLPPRQRTLVRTLEWSYELHGPAERTLLDRLSVFSGGFELADVLAVCGGEGLDGEAVLDGLAALVDASLVIRTRAPVSELRLLETVRRYAAGRLEASADAGRARARHARHFRALAEAGKRSDGTAAQAEWLRRLEAAQADLRTALGWFEAHDHAGWIRMATALSWFWVTHGHLDEGRAWLERALDAGTPAEEDRCPALHALARLAYWQGDYGRAEELAEQSLGLARSLSDGTAAGWALNLLAYVRGYRGEREAARAALREVLASAAAGDDLRLDSTIGLSDLLLQEGRTAEARACLERAMAQADRRDAPWQAGRGRLLLGIAAYLDGDDGAAARWLAESLGLLHLVGNWYGLAGAFDAIGAVTLRRGDAEAALRLTSAASTLRGLIGAPLPASWRGLVEELVIAPARAATPRAHAAWTEGGRLSMEETIACARGRLGEE